MAHQKYSRELMQMKSMWWNLQMYWMVREIWDFESVKKFEKFQILIQIIHLLFMT